MNGRYMRSCKVLIDGSLDEGRAREAAERMARDVLSNPIIEDFRVEIER